MTPRPSISVAMATYNGANYVREQLESIFAQTYPPDEVIICDDLSSDTTIEQINAFQQRFPEHVRVYRNEKNLGFIHNFEKAISLCTGDIIALSDQDDFWLPHKLEKIMSVFQEHPACGLVFSDAEVTDRRLNPTGYTIYTRFPAPDLRAGKTILGFMHGIKLLGCTLAFRTKYRPYLLPFAKDGWGHDHWVAFILSLISQLCFIDEPLMKYRRHNNHAGNSAAWKTDVRARVVQKFEGLSLENYQYDYQRWHEMLQRLLKLQAIETQDFSGNMLSQGIAEVKSRADFARRRLAIKRQARLLRFPAALRLLQEGEYTKYVRGKRTFLKDLLA